jgi:hypothetical protein
MRRPDGFCNVTCDTPHDPLTKFSNYGLNTYIKSDSRATFVQDKYYERTRNVKSGIYNIDYITQKPPLTLLTRPWNYNKLNSSRKEVVGKRMEKLSPSCRLRNSTRRMSTAEFLKTICLNLHPTKLGGPSSIFTDLHQLWQGASNAFAPLPFGVVDLLTCAITSKRCGVMHHNQVTPNPDLQNGRNSVTQIMGTFILSEEVWRKFIFTEPDRSWRKPYNDSLL